MLEKQAAHRSAHDPTGDPARRPPTPARPVGDGLHRALGNGALAAAAEAVRALDGPGTPLGAGPRAAAARAVGHDPGDVRVHTGPRIRAAARAAGAAGFTFGRDIGIATGPGEDAPHALLVHEAVHAAQQGVGGLASAEAAEHQAAEAGRGARATALAGVAAPYVAWAPEDWLHSTPDVRRYGLSDLTDEARAVDEWLDRQISSTPETDRMLEAKAALRAELARRAPALTAAGPRGRPAAARGARRPAAAAPEPALPDTEMPHVLRDRASTALTDPAEIRAESDRIAAWLLRPDVSRADRALLREELALLAPAVTADLDRARTQRRQTRLARALSPATTQDRAGVLGSLRIIDSIRPYQAAPGSAYVIHEGEMLVFPLETAQRVRAEVLTSLAEAARRARGINDSTQFRMNEHLRLNYEEHEVVGFLVSVFSGEEPVALQSRMLGPLAESNMALARFRAAARGGSLADMGDAVLTAVEQADRAQRIVLDGIDRAVATAGAIVHGLEITRNLAFAVALSVGAVLAAPVVAAGVAGLGATGLTATVLTAAGTGAAVGGEGLVLGFTSGAGGELVAGHGARAALSAGVDEGLRVGAQGVQIGVGAGVGLAAARTLGVGAQGLSRLQSLGRGALAQGAGNAAGGITGALLTPPEGTGRGEAALRAGLTGFGLGALGGVAGTYAQSLSSPTAQWAVGAALPAAVDAGATYLQTGDLSQSFLSAGTSLAVGALVTGRPTGLGENAQQRAFEAGQSVRRGAAEAGQSVRRGVAAAGRQVRSYVAGAAIGLADPVPALRLQQTSSSITLSGGQRPGAASPRTGAPDPKAPTALAPQPPSAPAQQSPADTAVAQASVPDHAVPSPATVISPQTRAPAVSQPRLLAQYERVANSKMGAVVLDVLSRQRTTPTRTRLGQLRQQFDQLRGQVGNGPMTPTQRADANAILREARDLARADFDNVRDAIWRRLRADTELRQIEGQLQTAGDAAQGGTALQVNTRRAAGTQFESLGVEHRTRLSDDPWRYNDPANLIVTDAAQNEQYLEALRRHGSIWPTGDVEDFVIRHQLNDQGVDFGPKTRQ
ncbi:eCIS core domain-containing protein [Streptomyces griseorubiginosus]|uniref:eCIS core domain-containing protein n=1 Tax=Streptomyces griseorubiginosus TaxID=67304 RepID=UPI0033DC3D9F